MFSRQAVWIRNLNNFLLSTSRYKPLLPNLNSVEMPKRKNFNKDVLTPQLTMLSTTFLSTPSDTKLSEEEKLACILDLQMFL